MDKIYKDVPNFEGLQKMKDYYNSMKYTTIEQGGFRVGETKVDEVTMYILRDFFKDYADGFFSRTLPSPFHFEEGGMLHPEIIIFNPIECGIELLNEAPYAVGALNDGLIMMQFVNNQLPGMEGLNDASSMMDTLDITDLVSSKRKVALIRSVYNMPKIKKENVKYKSPSNEDFIIQLQNEDNKTVSIEKIGEKYGKLWRTKYFYLGETGPAKPTCNITGYLMRLRKIQEP
jgi:hypothetical protein